MNCPKCWGRVIAEKDWQGAFKTCLACGRVSYLEPVEDYIPDRGRRKRLVLPRPPKYRG